MFVTIVKIVMVLKVPILKVKSRHVLPAIIQKTWQIALLKVQNNSIHTGGRHILFVLAVIMLFCGRLNLLVRPKKAMVNAWPVIPVKSNTVR
ncbi:MAG: hypothetical protein BA864_15270 [Desulfuromonadales bacterium C00003093]|nr:MAG: hypothetical protein BA864_15270 [Desulfuromonadales bacterium C00003093]